MFYIRRNCDESLSNMVMKSIADNKGHCPCQIPATEDTICPCKYFREEVKEGFCLCNLYEKVRISNES